MTKATNGGGGFDQRGQQVHEQTNVAGDQIINTGDQAYDVSGLENPYLGLKAFTYEERAYYAGREAEVARGVSLLTAPGSERTLLFVTGASGSGKSSFVQAGLLPALERYYQQRGQIVRWAVMRPSGQPLARLGDALGQVGLSVEGAFVEAGGAWWVEYGRGMFWIYCGYA